MTLRATTTFEYTSADGSGERFICELASDVGYSPDLAEDLTARVGNSVITAMRETWPESFANSDAVRPPVT